MDLHKKSTQLFTLEIGVHVMKLLQKNPVGLFLRERY